MAYEASEIMLAASLMYPTSELMEYSKSVGGLRELMIDAKKKIISGTNKTIHFGNPTIEKGFTDLMNENDIKKLSDLAAGISAAIGFRNYLASEGESGGKNLKPSIYMTGNVWPKEVEKFRISHPVFEDYNSADVIATADGETFYGLSLKKKPNVKAGEPTLINKAFDTLLNGPEFEDVKADLANARVEYFTELVIQAVKKGIINKKDIPGFDSMINNKEGRKELFVSGKRDKTKFEEKYINVKGFYDNPEGGYNPPRSVERKIMTDKRSMRYFVNKSLSDENNPLWNKFIATLNEHSDLFADTLIDVVLKSKLYDKIDAKDLGKYKFNFCLVTGIAEVSEKKGEVRIVPANVISLKTTLCGLTRINEKYKNGKFEVVLDSLKKEGSEAAKIYLQLKKGALTLLDLEIRYKGDFSPQPQFQGTISNQFKELLKKECS